MKTEAEHELKYKIVLNHFLSLCVLRGVCVCMLPTEDHKTPHFSQFNYISIISNK